MTPTLSKTSRPSLSADANDRLASALERIAALREGRDDGSPIDFRGLRLVNYDLSGLDLSNADLSGADLSRANLSDATLFGARLVGATLFETNLAMAELSGADLSGANLEAAKLERAGLGMARLEGANLGLANLSHATLTEAVLRNADLRSATLDGVRAMEADLSGANLSQARCHDAQFDRCKVRGTVFDGADLRRSSLVGLRDYARARWIGVNVREIDFTGAYLCRNFIMDANFIEEFRIESRQNRIIYEIWRLTSDCGRSLVRWTFCTGVILLAFCFLYTLVEVDYGRYETPISPLYFSVVTLTTLGFGDVQPASVGGQIIAMLEVITGYVMLGGLLSIFSNKMAARANR